MLDSLWQERLRRYGGVALDRLRGPAWALADARWERDAASEGVFDGKNLLIFGDSQAAGWPLRRTFGRLPIRSRGLGGDRARTARSRFEQDLAALRPTATLLLLGTNDLYLSRGVPDVADDLRDLARDALAVGVRPTLGSVLPVTARHEARRPSAQIRALNEALRRVAGELGIFYLDFWEKLADEGGSLRADATFDGLHPNLEGYLRMTEAVLEVFYCRSGQWKRGSAPVW